MKKIDLRMGVTIATALGLAVAIVITLFVPSESGLGVAFAFGSFLLPPLALFIRGVLRRSWRDLALAVGLGLVAYACFIIFLVSTYYVPFD